MSILSTIKQLLGISVEDTSFDMDIIIYINTVLGILTQLGLDEAGNEPIINKYTTWEDLLDDRTDLEFVKTYIHLKVKSMFDPPSSSAGMEAMNSIIKELEWRINNFKEVKSDEGRIQRAISNALWCKRYEMGN